MRIFQCPIFPRSRLKQSCDFSSEKGKVFVIQCIYGILILGQSIHRLLAFGLMLLCVDPGTGEISQLLIENIRSNDLPIQTSL